MSFFLSVFRIISASLSSPINEQSLISSPKVLNAFAILYPTPAVCGLPKGAARDFIVKNEYAPRQYYSGFVGPLDPNGETHLFVSLRCMRIAEGECFLFAGGGLLADSDQEAEWRETEDKMETMGVLLHKNA